MDHQKVEQLDRVPEAIKKLAIRAANGYGSQYFGNLVCMEMKPSDQTEPLLHGVERVWLLFRPADAEEVAVL